SRGEWRPRWQRNVQGGVVVPRVESAHAGAGRQAVDCDRRQLRPCATAVFGAKRGDHTTRGVGYPGAVAGRTLLRLYHRVVSNAVRPPGWRNGQVSGTSKVPLTCGCSLPKWVHPTWPCVCTRGSIPG